MKKYQFEVKTSDQYLAGTNSNIFVILHGELKTSNEVRLNAYIHHNAFERNEMDKFDISFDDLGGDLGRIYKIEVRSDCKWNGSDWRLNFIRVKRIDGECNLLSNIESQFNFNRWIKDKKKHSCDVDISWSNNCKYECIIEDYSETPLSVGSKSNYHYKKTIETTSGFHYSTVVTKENTTNFNGEIRGSANYSETKKLANELDKNKAAEAFIRFGFNKGFSESKVEESVKNEDEKITITKSFDIVNDTEGNKDYVVIYKIRKINAIVTLDTIVGEFSVNNEIIFAGVKDLITGELAINGDLIQNSVGELVETE